MKGIKEDETRMEKLLVIGAGIGQVNMIKKAKAAGIHVTVATLPGNQPGINIADDVIYCDVYQREEIVRLAKEHGITAVTSDQNDLMNPTVAYVAEKLDLPGNTYKQVMSYCSKTTYRDNCDKLGIPGSRHVAVENEDYDFSAFDAPFPWIVKPSDSQSSVGVQRIDEMHQLRPALRFALSKSPTHKAIVEEFFIGKEIVCEGFIEDGKYRLLAFADRKYFDLDKLLIPSQTLFPSQVSPELLARVVECEKKMAAYIHPAFGITHSEYLVNEDRNEICVVESALRGGGVYISSHLIPLCTGIDINDILLQKVMGRQIDIEEVFEQRKAAASGYVCFYLPEGTVDEIKGKDDLKKMNFVKMASIDDIEVGQVTERMVHKGLRKGPILVAGENRTDLENKIKLVQETLQIFVRSPEGDIKGTVWE